MSGVCGGSCCLHCGLRASAIRVLALLLLVSPFKILNTPVIKGILNILYTLAIKANIKYFERRHSMWTNAYSYEDIGEFLREARRARGITQIEMARKLGFSSVTLSALETGKNVSAVKVDRYLQQLGFRMVIVPKGADVEVAERPSAHA